MRLADSQPSRRRGGVPKGEMCAGCGGVSTGVHLDHDLLPSAQRPLRKILEMDLTALDPGGKWRWVFLECGHTTTHDGDFHALVPCLQCPPTKEPN